MPSFTDELIFSLTCIRICRKSIIMDTTNVKEGPVCATCQIEMQKKEADINVLDVNYLSLLSMFRIQHFIILECPVCQRTGLSI